MTPRNDIPQNVANGIVDALVALDRHQWFHPYAAVSRNFQTAIEARIFRELYLTSARLDDLGTIVTKKRQDYVQVITLHVALASYKIWQQDDRESQGDGDRATQVFTGAMQELFVALSSWNLSHGSSGGIHLELLVESPSDDSAQTSRHSGPSKTRRARRSVASLDIYAETLPDVSVVSALTCSGTGRHIKLETVSILLAKLSGLRLLDVELEHDTNDERDMERRQAFILGLEHYAPKVTYLRLRRPHTTPEARKRSTNSSDTRSLFYSILARFTSRCTDLTFDDSIDARGYLASFEDERQSEQQLPQWPCLERLHIRNSYLMRSPYMRAQTRAQAMHQVDKILMLVGRAMRCMPVVSDVKIRLYVFAEARLEQTNVQYDAWDGGARVKFTGRTPMSPTVDVWKRSVMATRGVELQVL